jgi:protein involved in polysaccharide export with SLBB domain
MLDSSHMELFMFGEGREVTSVFGRSLRSLCLRVTGLAALACLPVIGITQVPTQTTGPTTPDCSDPVTADSPECTGQSAQPSAGITIPSTSPQQARPQVPYSYADLLNMQRTGQYPSQFLLQLPPEPLTEFQKFVASTTGQILPIYGADLFRNVPSTFVPLEMAPVPADYVVGPGDELRIRVWGQISFETNLTVDRAGEVYLPQIGPVHVAGVPFSSLEGHLRQAVGRVFHNFDLTVDLGRIRSIQVYVAGQARRPGVYTVSALSTLVDTLFASNGPSIHGSFRDIELRREGTVVTHFDLYDLLVHGDKSKDAKLLSGDVIFIPPAGAQVAVTGSVRNPAVYEIKPGDTLKDLIGYAGGVTAVASSARISVERIQNRAGRAAMEVSDDEQGLATALADGDLVRVNPLIPAYQKTVTIRGNLANPGRFTWHPGMRVSELIPDKGSLITRNYWWKRAEEGLPAPEFEPATELSNLRQPQEPVNMANPAAMSTLQQYPYYPGQQFPNSTNQQSPNAAAQQNPSAQQAPSAQQNPNAPQQNPYGATPQNSAQPYPQNPENQYPNPNDEYSNPNCDQTYPMPDQFGNLPSGLYSPNQMPRTTSGTMASAESAIYAQSPCSQFPGAQRTTVRIPAPEIDWDYAVIERLDSDTLKTKLIPFDLGKLVLQHDASQDLELQPGDVISIFSEADIRLPQMDQTKLIRLEGEFAHAGTYSALPGETLRQLVERAGGFTPKAYLFGSEFTRVSTRKLQQARIDQYIQNLELEIQRGSLALAASNGASQSVAQSTQITEQQIINELRQVRATGRIVLEFKAGSSGVASLPEIPLENGDVFVVPSPPSSVNVVGSVYDQSSFLYEPNRNVGAYLHLAGGPNRNADRRHEFVIRADGEVISRASVHGAWGDDFDRLRLNPGDTIVVPEKTIKVPFLQSASQWSAMFSQLALGAAYLAILP